jgi:hypothetical protein
VIGLNMDEDEARVRSYLKTNNVPGRQYFDGRGLRNELALKYRIGQADYAFVLDRQGRIVAMEPESREDVEKALVKALKQK